MPQMCVWRSEDSFPECLFHHVSPGDQTQVVRVSSDCVYPLSHLPNPAFFLSFVETWSHYVALIGLGHSK